MPISANVIYSVSVIFSIPKFHIYIVMVLANLSVRSNNSNFDKLFLLKKAILSPY